MPLAIAAGAAGSLTTLTVLQLIGDVLITWYICHKPLTLPQIKKLERVRRHRYYYTIIL